MTEADDAAADDVPAPDAAQPDDAQSDDTDVDTASEDVPPVDASGSEPDVAPASPAANAANAINDDAVIAGTTWQPLTVTSNTSQQTWDRTFDWTLEKSATIDGQAVVDPVKVASSGTATFDYQVTATPSGPKDSNFAHTGQLVVNNPNVGSMVVTLVETGAATGCVYDAVDIDPNTDGLQVSVPAGDTTYTYTCAVSSSGSTSSNPGNITWSQDDYPGAGAGTSKGATFGSGPNVTNGSVAVIDDKVAGPQQTLGVVTLSNGGTVQPGDGYAVKDGAAVFSYGLELSAPAGQCHTHVNTAQLQSHTLVPQAMGGSEISEPVFASVEVCAGADLEVAKSALLAYDREYLWSIDKDAPTTVFAGMDEAGETYADVHYMVTVTPAGYVDTEVQLTGEVTIQNPNAWQDITATVTDEVSLAGSVCTFDGVDADPDTAGFQVVVPAGELVDGEVAPGSVTLTYSCTESTSGSYYGSNTVTVTWDGEEHSTPSDEVTDTVNIAQLESGINQSVLVSDEMAPEGTFEPVESNSDGVPTTFYYSVEITGQAGVCLPVTNEAFLTEHVQLMPMSISQAPTVIDTAQHTVQICSPGISKTADATFDRTFDWVIEKEADAAKVQAAANGKAKVGYAVTATSTGHTDSGHSLSGEITVTNPAQDHDAVLLFDADDAVDIEGATCLVEGGTEVELAAGDSVTLAYSCELPEGYTPGSGETNGAIISWISEDQQAVAWTTTEVQWQVGNAVDQSVQVVDDKTVPGSLQLLGTVTLDDDGNMQPGAGYTVDADQNSALFEYELSLASEPGVCVTHTNIAALDLAAGEGPMASADVEVCQDSSVVPPAKPKPAKALASTGVSTGPALLWALGLIGAGVVVLAAGKLRRR